jgi:hypothetical protein
MWLCVYVFVYLHVVCVCVCVCGVIACGINAMLTMHLRVCVLVSWSTHPRTHPHTYVVLLHNSGSKSELSQSL